MGLQSEKKYLYIAITTLILFLVLNYWASTVNVISKPHERWLFQKQVTSIAKSYTTIGGEAVNKNINETTITLKDNIGRFLQVITIFALYFMLFFASKNKKEQQHSIKFYALRNGFAIATVLFVAIGNLISTEWIEAPFELSGFNLLIILLVTSVWFVNSSRKTDAG